MEARQEKATRTRLINTIRKHMHVDGAIRSAPERNGVLRGSDIELYDRKGRELYELLAAMPTEERASLMAQTFPLPKPYDELSEEDQATARCWNWKTRPEGPFAVTGTRNQTATCGRPWVAEIGLCPRCGKGASVHPVRSEQYD